MRRSTHPHTPSPLPTAGRVHLQNHPRPARARRHRRPAQDRGPLHQAGRLTGPRPRPGAANTAGGAGRRGGGAPAAPAGRSTAGACQVAWPRRRVSADWPLAYCYCNVDAAHELVIRAAGTRHAQALHKALRPPRPRCRWGGAGGAQHIRRHSAGCDSSLCTPDASSTMSGPEQPEGKHTRRGLGVEALPDHALGRIFTLLGKQERCAGP